MKSQKSLRLPKKRKRTWPLLVRRVSGHSMMPSFPPGTLVFGWRWLVRVRLSDVVIFHHEGREKIKRVDQLDADKLFVIGDHPDASTDSRSFGWIDRENIVAKVIWARVRE